MRILSVNEKPKAQSYLERIIEIAKQSTCSRSKCGSIVVYENEIIGEGFNSPPYNSQNRCSNDKKDYDLKVTDKTCCVHAEQRAIMDALKMNPDKLKGSRLYFIRLDANDQKKESGDPYCTICSKMALDTGISEFVLWRKEGITVFDTKEYNDLSYNYKSK